MTRRSQSQHSQIECLACGAVRPASGDHRNNQHECPRCRYLGWAYSADLGETTRGLIRDRALALH